MSRTLRCAALIGLLLACSCSRVGRSKTTEGVPPTSPFVASAQYPFNILRLSTANNEDVRQACYLATPEGLRIAAVLRNFERRSEGRLDLHRLILLDPERGEMQDEVLPGEPVALWHSPGHKAGLVGCLAETAGEGYSAHDLNLFPLPPSLPGPDGSIPALSKAFWPATVDDAGEPVGLAVRGVRVASGTAEVELDYSAGLRSSASPGEGSVATRLISPDGRLSASWEVSSDQASGWKVTFAIWSKGKSRKPVATWSEPFPGVAGLVPEMAWVDAGHLAWQSYEPMKGPDGSEYWLDRLICGELSSGKQWVLADHLPRRASWVSDYAGVFYAVPSGEVSADGQVWEAWVSNADGLTKRLLWRGPALRLEVCDALDGQRVLLHRQYLLEAGGAKLLHSELLEATLQAPTGSSLRLGVDPLPSVPEAEADSSSSVPASPQGAEGAGQATEPGEQDGGAGDGSAGRGGGFIPDEPAPEGPLPPPSEPGKPPPIG